MTGPKCAYGACSHVGTVPVQLVIGKHRAGAPKPCCPHHADLMIAWGDHDGTYSYERASRE